MTKKKEETALAAQGPNTLATQEPMTGEFMEGIEQSDFQVPTAYTIQGTGSDQRAFPGVAIGTLVNTITKEAVASREFVVIPGGYKDWFDGREDATVMSSRSQADWPDVDTDWDARRKAGMDDPPPVYPRLNFLVLFKDEPFPIVVRFKRTSYGTGRTLNYLLGMHKGRMLYTLGSREENKGKGAYLVLTISPAGLAPADLYAAACSWATQLAGKDLAEIAPETHEEAAETTADMPF